MGCNLSCLCLDGCVQIDIWCELRNWLNLLASENLVLHDKVQVQFVFLSDARFIPRNSVGQSSLTSKGWLEQHASPGLSDPSIGCCVPSSGDFTFAGTLFSYFLKFHHDCIAASKDVLSVISLTFFEAVALA